MKHAFLHACSLILGCCLLLGAAAEVRTDALDISALPSGSVFRDASFSCRTEVPAASAGGAVVLFADPDRAREALDDSAWAEFARTNKLTLCSFAFRLSGDGSKNRESIPSWTNFEMVVCAHLRKMNLARLPLAFYGLDPNGAAFTANFAERARVLSSALKVKCWGVGADVNASYLYLNDDFKPATAPLAVIGCRFNTGGARNLFDRGRQAERRWTLAEYESDSEFPPFVRAFFAAVFSGKVKGEKESWRSLSVLRVLKGSADDKSRGRFLSYVPPPLEPQWEQMRKALGEKHPELTTPIYLRTVRLSLDDFKEISFFLRLPANGHKPKGLYCHCLLTQDPGELCESLRRGHYPFAKAHDLAVMVWGSRRMWDVSKNWDNSMGRDGFKNVANAWRETVDVYHKEFGVPTHGHLLTGFCGAAQFAHRLALAIPERFLAVHMDLSGSFGRVVLDGKSTLWCLTTGEKLSGGYEHSLEFYATARKAGYPFIFKAYPGVDHSHTRPSAANRLRDACFTYALEQYERTKPNLPDWSDLFNSADFVADIMNQDISPIEDYDSIPCENRMLLPRELKDAWLAE